MSDFVARWGRSPLLRPSAAAVADAGLPADSASFLVEQGLPATAEPGFEFDFPGGRIPALSELERPPRGLTAADLGRYRRIGGSGRAHVCIDSQENGRIVQVLDVQPTIVRFVNSSIPQLAESLLVYRAVMEETLVREAAATRAAVDAAVGAADQAPAERQQRQRQLRDAYVATGPARRDEDDRARARLDTLRKEIGLIDAAAVAPNTLWEQTIDGMAIMGGLAEQA